MYTVLIFNLIWQLNNCEFDFVYWQLFHFLLQCLQYVIIVQTKTFSRKANGIKVEAMLLMCAVLSGCSSYAHISWWAVWFSYVLNVWSSVCVCVIGYVIHNLKGQKSAAHS